MKKTLKFLPLVVLTIGLLGSCTKIEERVDDLENRIDNIESEKLVTIARQIDGIEASIADLSAIRKDILDLISDSEKLGEDISSLKEADTIISNRIDELMGYLDGELKNFASTEWVEATFATLEQFKATETAVSDLGKIVDDRFESLTDELGKRVNDRFESLTDELGKRVDDCYESLTDEIDSCKRTLEEWQDALEDTIKALTDRVEALETMIQKVTIVPEYHDGSVKAEDGIVSLDCIIEPVEAVYTLEAEDLTVLVNEVITKSANLESVSVSELSKDMENGVVSFRADLSEFIPQEADKALSIAVNVSNGLSDFTTNFVPVYVIRPISWEPVTTNSVFKNGLFGMPGGCEPGSEPSLIYPVSVEKRTDADIFRVKNIAKSSVCAYAGITDLDGDMYFYIDATDPDFVTVEGCGLKVHVDDGNGEVWAGTDCSAFDPRNKVGGTYDPDSGILRWTDNQLYCWMPDYRSVEDGSFWKCHETVLWLDDKYMEVDFLKEYKFEKAFMTHAYQICEAYDFKYDGAPVYIGEPLDPARADILAEKYGTVYCIKDCVYNGYDIFFNVDNEGKVSLPDNYRIQNSGCEFLGFDTYIAIKGVEITEGCLKVVYDVVKKDHSVLGADYTDYYYQFDSDATIDDYVGTYTCASLGDAVVTVQKVSDTELSVSGLCEYGPFTFVMVSGYPYFKGGQLAGSDYYAYIGNSDAGSFYSAFYETLYFRRTADGTLLPLLTDMAKYNDIYDILILQQTQLGWSLGNVYPFSDLVLTPAEPVSTTKAASVINHGRSDVRGGRKPVLRLNGNSKE